MASSNT